FSSRSRHTRSKRAWSSYVCSSYLGFRHLDPLHPSKCPQNQHASGSFPDYLMKRAGFEDTSKDEEDPNGENRAEFGLSSRDGKNSYLVTPLTSRGSTSSLIAL